MLLKAAKVVAATIFCALSANVATAQPSVRLEAVVSGINTPLAMVQPPGDSRMFIIEQNGRIRIWRAS